MKVMRSTEYGVRSKRFKFFSYIFIFSFQLSANCFAQDVVSSTELIEHAKDFDGKKVVYRGEVIGEVMARKDYAWVNTHDGVNAIGVWVKKDTSAIIEYTGSFKAQGDRVETVGIFHRACSQHGGDLDIHAESLTKVISGYPVYEKTPEKEKKITVALAGIMLCLLILQILKKKRG